VSDQSVLETSQSRQSIVMDPLEETPWADTAAQSSTTTSQTDEPAASSAAKSPAQATAPSSTRSSRMTPRRLVAQPTRLEAVEDDPLGPLGASSGPLEAPPAPPQKEAQQQPLAIRTTLPASQQPQRKPDPHRIDDEDDDDAALGRAPRVPPPVQPAQPSSVRSGTLPSVSVEQAANPTFHITVGDPHKVGDLTSSHIVYSVRTKVLFHALCLGHPRPGY